MKRATIITVLILALTPTGGAAAQTPQPALESAWEMCLDAVQTDDMSSTIARAAPAAGYREFQPGWFGRQDGGMTIVVFTGDDEWGDPICGVRNDAIERDALIARGAAYWRGRGLATDTSLWLSAHDEARGLVASIHKPNEFFQTSVSKY